MATYRSSFGIKYTHDCDKMFQNYRKACDHKQLVMTFIIRVKQFLYESVVAQCATQAIPRDERHKTTTIQLIKP